MIITIIVFKPLTFFVWICSLIFGDVTFFHIQIILIYNILFSLETQRDTSGLTTENRELKLRLQSMEEQAKLRDGMF